MKTVCYNLPLIDADTLCAIYNELFRIPCFIDWNQEQEEITIQARQEDIPFVEKVVAQYV